MNIQSTFKLRRGGQREKGFTFLEVAVAVGVFSVLIVSVMSVAVETSHFVTNTDTDFLVQAETHRSTTRISEIVRKTGWSTASGVTYPRVIDGGSTLEFRLLQDLDGNGYPYDGTTGELEWGAAVFAIRHDASTNTLTIEDAVGNPLRSLGRYIQNVNFATVNEDNTLHLMEIQVTLVATKPDKDGNPINFVTTNSIHMRN